MGLIYSVLTSILLSFTISQVPYTALEQAFKQNDAKEIVSMGKEKILVNVLGTEGVYSQSQAGMVLKDFFTRNSGGDFQFFFKGKESADGTFAIGNYKSKGETYRVTIHFKRIQGDYKIESLTIEK